MGSAAGFSGLRETVDPNSPALSTLEKALEGIKKRLGTRWEGGEYGDHKADNTILHEDVALFEIDDEL